MYNSYCTFCFLSHLSPVYSTRNIIWTSSGKICHTLKHIQDISRHRMTKRPHGHIHTVFTDIFYLLKKSGILIDCSFTFGDGVFGMSSDDACCGAAAVLLGTAVVPPFLVGAMPKSSFGGCGAAPTCFIPPCFSYPSNADWAPAGLGLSSLDFSLEAVPPTL